MKLTSNIRSFAMAFSLAIVTLLLPTLGHAQTNFQTYDGGTNTWDMGVTPDWSSGPTWTGGYDNAYFGGTNTLNVDNTNGQVTVNYMEFYGSNVSTVIQGDTLAENPWTSNGYETLINVDGGSGPVTFTAPIVTSDTGGNEQTYINNSSSSTLTLGNVTFAPYTLTGSTSDARMNFQASGSGGITLTGTYTATNPHGGELNFGTNGAGTYTLAPSADFTNFNTGLGGGQEGNSFSFNGDVLNIETSKFDGHQTIGFGNPSSGDLVNIVGTQNITLGVYDSMKHGQPQDPFGANITGVATFNQSTADQSSWAGGVDLDGSSVALNATAGGRLNWNATMGGNAPLGITVNSTPGSTGVVVISNSANYNEADGQGGGVQPSSVVSGEIMHGTLLITNAVNTGSIFGNSNLPVKVDAGAKLGGSGYVVGQTVMVAGGGIIAPGDPGHSSLSYSVSTSMATLHLTGGLSMASGAEMAFKLNGAANDAIDLGAGNLTLNGTVNLDFTSLGSVQGYDPVTGRHYYTLLTGSGTWTSNPSFDITAPAGYKVDQLYYGLVNTNPMANDPNKVLEIEFGVVPEPSTYALMIGGLAFLAYCVRRKNRMA